MTQSASLDNGQVEEVANFQVGVTVQFNRKIDIEGTDIGFLGRGGRMLVHMNNDGTVVWASRVWRDIQSLEEVEVKSYEEAYEEALSLLHDPEKYALTHWEWGYKEEVGSVAQDTMKIIYLFYFTFKETESDDSEILSTEIVEIDGQEGI